MAKLRIERFLQDIRDHAAAKAEGKVRNWLRLTDEDEDDPDDDDDDSDDPTQNPEPEGILDGDGFSFEYAGKDGADQNLASAAAAWRAAGFPKEHIVAQHQATGIAFCGTEGAWQRFSQQRQIKGSWDFYEDAGEIADLDYDPDVMARVLEGEDEADADETAKFFEDVHWGDAPETYSLIDTPGISESLAFFGVPRTLEIAVDDDSAATYRFGQRGTIPGIWVPKHGKYFIFHGPGFSADRLLQALRLSADALHYTARVPGIDEPLADLGPALRIEYFAQKGGEPDEYYHIHGEQSDKYPHVLVPRHLQWIAVHGGKMRVEGRGVVE